MTLVAVITGLGPLLALLLLLAGGRYPGEERIARARRACSTGRRDRGSAAPDLCRVPPVPPHLSVRPLLLAARCAGRAPPVLAGPQRTTISLSNTKEHHMTSRIRTTAVLTAAVALLAPAAAQAHVTVQPAIAQAGSFTVENVRVPNESDGAATTKVVVQLPDEFYFASYQAVPGWKVKVAKQKLATPAKVEDDGKSFPVEEQVKQVTFTATSEKAGIQPGAFQDFPLSVRVPDKAGQSLTFKAVQTYSDGEVARWIGPPDAEKPAPQLKVIEAAEGDAEPTGGSGVESGSSTGEEAAASTPVAAAPVAATVADGGTDGLAIIALIVGALGLLAGLAGLGAARRARA